MTKVNVLNKQEKRIKFKDIKVGQWYIAEEDGDIIYNMKTSDRANASTNCIYVDSVDGGWYTGNESVSNKVILIEIESINVRVK